jgi:hypothetical protein
MQRADHPIDQRLHDVHESDLHSLEPDADRVLAH